MARMLGRAIHHWSYLDRCPVRFQRSSLCKLGNSLCACAFYDVSIQKPERGLFVVFRYLAEVYDCKYASDNEDSVLGYVYRRRDTQAPD